MPNWWSKLLRPLPMPMLQMAIRKGEVASLAVPVSRELIPDIRHKIHGVADTKEAGKDALLVLVDEDKDLGWRRVDELREFGFVE